MNPIEKEVIERVFADFEKLKKRKSFTAMDADALMHDISALLGIYDLKADKGLAALIEEMITFGEKKGWALEGCRILFERIKARHSRARA